MLIKKAIKDLTKEERLTNLSYNEINKNFTFKNKSYESLMIGNTFYILTAKERFRKQKDLLILTCCCGVSIQTMIDIMTSYDLVNENTIIEFEIKERVETEK